MIITARASDFWSANHSGLFVDRSDASITLTLKCIYGAVLIFLLGLGDMAKNVIMVKCIISAHINNCLDMSNNAGFNL